MGCACCAKHLDSVAPNHKPYKVPPGSTATAHRSGGTLQPGQHHDAASKSASSTAPAFGEAIPQKRKDAVAVAIEVGTSPGGLGQGAARSAASILTEGSAVQGLWLAPWNDTDEDVATNFGLGRSLVEGDAGRQSCAFEDADGLLELSARQREALHAWRRLGEVIRSSKCAQKPAVLSSKMSSRSIKQGLVGDCSFLSALSALAEYESTFKEPVLSDILHPRGAKGPIYSEYGQYGCRLFLNGTERKVIVDDRVPVRSNGQLLCAHSAYTNEIWVTLLEKSFAKIMGSSYDMQGSNPGTDVFHLTGWVPETIPLGGGVVAASTGAQGTSMAVAADGIERTAAGWDEVYNGVAKGYRNGHCVVCVGTSELHDAMPDAEARRLGHIEGVSRTTGLVARHAYPVIDCGRLGRHRLLRLKNPWGRIRWRGRFSPGDRAWREASTTNPGFQNGASSDIDAIGPEAAANNAAPGTADDGHFWIEWEDVLRYFSHLYLCWAPRAMGLRRLEAHGRWDPEPHFTRCCLPDDTHLVCFNPQFLLRLDEPVSVAAADVAAWVLLSRHVKLRADISSKYVAVHIYRSVGSRLCCPDAPLEQGVYSNGECALVKLRQTEAGNDKGREYIIVISQHNAKTVFNFTLQVYTPVSGTLTQLPPLVPEAYVSGAERGQWTRETAGGCSNNLWQYFQNPQWRIEVPGEEPATLIIFVECPAEYSVNVRLFRGAAARPEELRRAVSSGAYRQGCCVLRVADLVPGPHVVVVSTFHPGLCGEYRLAWHSSHALRFRPQPHPFAMALPSPLETVVHRMSKGRLRLQLHNGGHRGEPAAQAHTPPTLLSARLQVGKGCPPPSLGLLQPLLTTPSAPAPRLRGKTGALLEPARCELQKESYAESYFSFARAAVLLVAELAPGEHRVLEASFPAASIGGTVTAGSGGGVAAVDGGNLYITHDGPLAVEVDESWVEP